jgi:pimeloyl-ACP methyl ester carboxylesterase
MNKTTNNPIVGNLKRRDFLNLAAKTTISAAALSTISTLTFRPSIVNAKERAPKNYQIIKRTITQPVDHNNPRGKTFNQQIDILIPDNATKDAPVFFILGNEHDVQYSELFDYHEKYGARDDVIFVHAEHRGYGESLTDDDQSIPSYVTIDRALADYHEVVKTLKSEFPGPWMAAGYSYGGGLSINFAAKYPEDISVALSSSGVVDWPFVMDCYDRQVRLNLGEDIYGRISNHVKNLEPMELFDKNWIEREFLIAFVTGMTQYDEYESYVKPFGMLSKLPTGSFLKVLHLMDNAIANGAALNYALSNTKHTYSLKEAYAGKYNWRVWRYQQAIETGVFWVSSENGGIYTRTADDFIEECRAIFGEAPPTATKPTWSPREMVSGLKVPLVYVCGGRDPWKGLCLEEDYDIKSGKYFYFPELKHCPDRRDRKLGKMVMDEMLKFATKGKLV